MWINLMAAIGGAALIGAALGLLLVLCQYIVDLIGRLRLKHRYEHRFDKPPKAKCYCKDCKYWGYQGKCGKFEGWYTADNWFCWNAEPCGREAEGNG